LIVHDYLWFIVPLGCFSLTKYQIGLMPTFKKFDWHYEQQLKNQLKQRDHQQLGPSKNIGVHGNSAPASYVERYSDI